MGTSCAPVAQDLVPPIPTPLPVVSAIALLPDETDLAGTPFTPYPCEGWRCDNTDTSAGLNYEHYDPGLVSIDVFRLKGLPSAEEKFIERRDALFGSTLFLPSSPFETPPALDYRSPLADEFVIGCGVDLSPRCNSVARYGNYVITLDMHIDRWTPPDDTYAAPIEVFLRAIDQRVATQLGMPFPATDPTHEP
jgi:hypothetical protein